MPSAARASAVRRDDDGRWPGWASALFLGGTSMLLWIALGLALLG